MTGDVTVQNAHHEEYSSSDLENVFGICGGGLLTLNLVFCSACNISYALVLARPAGGAEQMTGLEVSIDVVDTGAVESAN